MGPECQDLDSGSLMPQPTELPTAVVVFLGVTLPLGEDVAMSGENLDRHMW